MTLDELWKLLDDLRLPLMNVVGHDRFRELSGFHASPDEQPRFGGVDVLDNAYFRGRKECHVYWGFSRRMVEGKLLITKLIGVDLSHPSQTRGRFERVVRQALEGAGYRVKSETMDGGVRSLWVDLGALDLETRSGRLTRLASEIGPVLEVYIHGLQQAELP